MGDFSGGVTSSSKLAWLRSALFVAVVLASGVSAVAASLAASGDSGANAKAVAARTQVVSLSTTMHLVGRPGHIVNEQGTVSGTYSGTATARFTSLSSNSGTVTVNFVSHGGTIFGRATTRTHVVGATAYFSGTGSITGGTGRWAHASAKGLVFSGTLNRQNYRTTTHMQGTLHY